jgi:lipopolysaccharide export system protein LptA
MKMIKTSLTFRVAASMCLAPVAFACMTVAHAERADRNKPIFWEADNGTYDDIKQVTVLKGSAVVTKGTLIIRADQILITQDPQGYQFGTASGTPNGPATFRQKRDAADQSIEGNAQQIEYDGKNDRIVLKGNALMRRLEAAVAADEAVGDVIVYDNRTDQYQVTGRRDAANSAPGRARGMIAPRMSATPGTATTAPGAQQPAKPVPLQPATALAPPAADTVKQ